MVAGTCFVEGMRYIAPNYDAFIIDQWGVLHQGVTPYLGATETLSELMHGGKTVVILTNSSKSNNVNTERLTRLGIPRTLYTALVSSAEVLRSALINRENLPWCSMGTRAFVVAAGTDAKLFNDSGISIVNDITQADFVVLLSVDGAAREEQHRHWIQVGAHRGIPLVGPSADPQSVIHDGVVTGLGAICTAYRNAGGTVTIAGKPEAIVYHECLSIIGRTDPLRIAAIGDQPASDVVGAHRHGLSSVLVGTGAMEAVFAGASSPSDWEARVVKLSEQRDWIPNWIIPSIRW